MLLLVDLQVASFDSALSDKSIPYYNLLANTPCLYTHSCQLHGSDTRPTSPENAVVAAIWQALLGSLSACKIHYELQWIIVAINSNTRLNGGHRVRLMSTLDQMSPALLIIRLLLTSWGRDTAVAAQPSQWGPLKDANASSQQAA